MNRPFHAFGALLILLAATMLAVNSGSRTTMFDRPPTTAKGGVSSRGSRLGGVYVVVMPSSEDEDGAVVETEREHTQGDSHDASSPEAEGRTLYDAIYDGAVYGELASKAAPDFAAFRRRDLSSSVRSGRWLLRFAVSSLNQMGRVCEAAAFQLESIGSDSVASDSDLLAR